jgi:hypothetical protein
LNAPVAVVIVVVLIAAAVFRFKVNLSSLDAGRTAFAPNPANDTEILCTGWDEGELEKILRGFTRAYKDQLGPSWVFRTEALSSDGFRVTFPSDIAPDSLSFLVNYLQYPEDLDFATHDAAVLGRVTLTQQFPLPRQEFVGKKARIYVPSNDREYDLVSVAVGSDYFERSFTKLEWKPVLAGRIPDGVARLW